MKVEEVKSCSCLIKKRNYGKNYLSDSIIKLNASITLFAYGFSVLTIKETYSDSGELGYTNFPSCFQPSPKNNFYTIYRKACFLQLVFHHFYHKYIVLHFFANFPIEKLLVFNISISDLLK